MGHTSTSESVLDVPLREYLEDIHANGWDKIGSLKWEWAGCGIHATIRLVRENGKWFEIYTQKPCDID